MEVPRHYGDSLTLFFFKHLGLVLFYNGAGCSIHYQHYYYLHYYYHYYYYYSFHEYVNLEILMLVFGRARGWGLLWSHPIMVFSFLVWDPS